MKIGESQIRGALFNFFVVKKCPFLHLPDAALSFYNNHCATIQNFNFPHVSIKKTAFKFIFHKIFLLPSAE